MTRAALAHDLQVKTDRLMRLGLKGDGTARESRQWRQQMMATVSVLAEAVGKVLEEPTLGEYASGQLKKGDERT